VRGIVEREDRLGGFAYGIRLGEMFGMQIRAGENLGDP
jgi:hypothetical protein